MPDLLVERSGGVVTLTLNRPERKNALSDGLLRSLRGAYLEIAERQEDRAVVVTGAGDGFCSGGDLTDPTIVRELRRGRGSALAWMRLVGSTTMALHQLPQPTIAAVNGAAIGAGANLAMACDLVVASTEARFAQGFMQRGLIPDFGGTWLLPRLVGLHRAKQLAFFGESLTATDALEMGLVNRVVEADQLGAAVQEWAARLSASAPIGLSMAKRLLNSSFSVSMDEALEHEAVAQNVAFSSADMAEAMRAFVERRPPEFSGE
jgi:2-(1,2-epoxy-1,2-dihydrophenyl)acetyl-CoA isomerase